MRFDSYHPALNLLFFAAVIAFSAAWSHPVLIATSFLGACAYSVACRGPRALALDAALIPLAAAFAALFAANVHFGVTNVGQTPIGNTVTVESAACGLLIGVKVAAVVVWASCVLSVFTADKVVFLIGRASPKLAMFLAIALRALPVAAAHAGSIAAARSGVGRGPGQGAPARRAAGAIARASALVSWSIDRFVQMSDSARCRGAGLRGRTAFSLYRFDNRDRALAVALVALITLCLVGTALDQTRMLFSPVLFIPKATGASIALYLAFAALCFLPLALQTIGEIAFRWRVGKRAHNKETI